MPAKGWRKPKRQTNHFEARMTHDRWMETVGDSLPTRVVGSFAKMPPDGRLYIDIGSRLMCRDGKRILMGPKRFRLAFGLACGTELNRRDLENLLWGDEADGGPLDLDGTFRQHLYYVKRDFKLLGLTIKNRWGYGFRLAEMPA